MRWSLRPDMDKKLYIKTFGCQMNEYDSTRLAESLLDSHGYQAIDTPEQADVLLLNTCSVREKAQEKLFSQLGRWRPWKEQNPDLLIGVGGCVASQEGEAILKKAPFVDFIFGPQTYHRVSELINQTVSTRRPHIDISFPEIEKFDRLPPRQVLGPRAFVSIMEGCSKYCSFCVVPYTRGEEYSRPFDSVITEIYELAEQGVREVTLLGQNVNAYRTVNHRGQTIDFAALLRYVNEIPGIGRIRYTTSHPLEFTDELARAHGEIPTLAKHLHLPVQSGSDKILARMKRRYTRKEYLQIIENVRSYCPGISISSDFIVGFPGETDQDFRQTMELVDEVGFDHSFSFLYSKRPGTPAADLQDETSETKKKDRLHELQARINTLASAVSDTMVNTVQSVLVEGTSRRRTQQICGRTENNRVVNFDGPEHLQGQFVDVLITDAMPNSMRGIHQDLHHQETVSN